MKRFEKRGCWPDRAQVSQERCVLRQVSGDERRNAAGVRSGGGADQPADGVAGGGGQVVSGSASSAAAVSVSITRK